jgi:hypothetical protein
LSWIAGELDVKNSCRGPSIPGVEYLEDVIKQFANRVVELHDCVEAAKEAMDFGVRVLIWDLGVGRKHPVVVGSRLAVKYDVGSNNID